METASKGAFWRCTLLGLVLLSVAAGPSLVIQVQNGRVLGQADQLYEASHGHGSPPTTGARLESSEKIGLSLQALYGRDVSEALQEMPAAQIESGLLQFWFTSLLTFAMAAFVRTRLRATLRKLIVLGSAWLLATVTVNVAVAATTVYSLGALPEDAWPSALRLVFAQVGVGALYLSWWTATQHMFGGSLLKWCSASAVSFWFVSGLRLSSEGGALGRYLPGGLEPWLFAKDASGVALGLTLCVAWCGAFLGVCLGVAEWRRRAPAGDGVLFAMRRNWAARSGK